MIDNGGPVALYIDGDPRATPSLGGVVLPDDGREYAALLPYVAGSSLAVYPVAGLPAVTLEGGGKLAIVTKGSTPYDGDATIKLEGEIDSELDALRLAV